MGLSQEVYSKTNEQRRLRYEVRAILNSWPYGIKQGKFRLVVVYGCDRSVSQNSLQGVDEICSIHLDVLRYSPCNLEEFPGSDVSS